MTLNILISFIAAFFGNEQLNRRSHTIPDPQGSSPTAILLTNSLSRRKLCTSPFLMLVIVGGPAGCGKSTVGGSIAENLEWPFLEGDSLHSAASIDKMSHGIPLTDDDRWGWLTNVAHESSRLAQNSPSKGCVVACSSLKKSYRDWIRHEAPDEQVVFIFVTVEKAELLRRTSQRKDHFMKADMVQSQLDIMEVPESGEPGCIVYLNVADITDCVSKIQQLVPNADNK